MEENRPLVTIAIPTYKRAHLLPRALESVANQTYKPIEVYVVDNATPGKETEEVVSTFQGRIPHLSYVRLPVCIGQIGNHLRCIEKARGTFFMWLCDDDALSPNYVEASVEALLEHPEALFSASAFFDSVYQKRIPPRGYMEDRRFSRVLGFLTEDLGIGEDVWAAGWARKFNWVYGLHHRVPLHESLKKVLEKYRFWWPNEQWEAGLDDLLLMEMLLRGKVVPVVNEESHYIYFRNTEKHYAGPRASYFFVNQLNKLRYAFYRINVYWIHTRQVCASEGLLKAVFFAILSAVHLMQDLFVSLYEQGKARFGKDDRS
ncbi:MAG: glycosyltransferase family 2 protein [Holosporales bacterium]|jgi:glycosyltransferase involved in cell wall biosynthesis|nr:glycosyltransferase family 2 protein [Holosporales bacterium]